MELVAWKPLIEIFSSHVKHELKTTIRIAQESNEVIDLPSLTDLFEKEDAVNLFKYQAGEKSVEAINTCLLAKETAKGGMGLLIDQIAVVEKLAGCRL